MKPENRENEHEIVRTRKNPSHPSTIPEIRVKKRSEANYLSMTKSAITFPPMVWYVDNMVEFTVSILFSDTLQPMPKQEVRKASMSDIQRASPSE